MKKGILGCDFARPAPVTLLVGRILRRAAGLSPRSIAATLDDESVTFADVDGGANRVAHVLSGHGVGPGDHIASWTDISLRLARCFLRRRPVGRRLRPAESGAFVGGGPRRGRVPSPTPPPD